jgi:mRNA-degrading endonuclease YafQ of YafQ-DinJ toxin-antitoxin module
MTTVLARFRSARTRHGALLAVLAAGSLATTAAPAPASAQEGHPLKGSWLGTWKDNAALGDDLILILEWDGKAITGMINPGTDNIPVGKATLDPNGWKVTIEADAKDKSGAALHYVVEATIENLELPNRSLVGTWRSQRGRGAFEASRQ